MAAVPFGLRGSVSAAVAATILAGPLMPLDVAQGLAQPAGNWATRGVFFLIVGLLAGATVSALRHSFEAGLTSRISQELEASATLFARHATIDWSARVQRVLDGKGLRMVFQPIYALDGGDLQAVEALARFSDDGPSAPSTSGSPTQRRLAWAVSWSWRRSSGPSTSPSSWTSTSG